MLAYVDIVQREGHETLMLGYEFSERWVLVDDQGVTTKKMPSHSGAGGAPLNRMSASHQHLTEPMFGGLYASGSELVFLDRSGEVAVKHAVKMRGAYLSGIWPIAAKSGASERSFHANISHGPAWNKKTDAFIIRQTATGQISVEADPPGLNKLVSAVLFPCGEPESDCFLRQTLEPSGAWYYELVDDQGAVIQALNRDERLTLRNPAGFVPNSSGRLSGRDDVATFGDAYGVWIFRKP